MLRVLFLCTGNSARSIIAEALLGTLGRGRFESYSAGSQPSGRVQPLAAEIAIELGYPSDKLRSKSWDEFAAADAPSMDLIITVCGNAAGETCPIWLDHPATAHWGVADPAAVIGDEELRRRAFQKAYRVLRQRVERLIALPVESLDASTLQNRATEIAAAVPDESDSP